MRIIFHPQAAAELAAAIDWYESRSAGLGAVLLANVERAIAAISEAPDTWPLWPELGDEAQIRRFLLSRFPFGIAYRLCEETVEVIAFVHLKRRPGYWKAR